nr:helix-turn-helix domain-containing protein [Allosediminivita pacifica]
MAPRAQHVDDNSPSPAELRSRLGANLRQLSGKAESISALCRDLGINRTQYNRYLAGESFPRPDVLHRICQYFGVDARILLEHVDELEASESDALRHPAVADFVGRSARNLEESAFPSGFYRFTRRSFLDTNRFVQALAYVYRRDQSCFMRGFEAKEAMRQQALDTSPRTREFRGILLAQEDGVAALLSRYGATTASFNYLARVPTFENNFWVGYTARTVREGVAGRRFERLVMEYIGRDTGKVLRAARTTGFCGIDDLVPYHRTLLNPEQPIT